MKVLLYDVDSKFPNLALMKLSAYHKARGDQVGFKVSNPDVVYASLILKKHRHKIDGLKFLYPDAEFKIGGPGYDLKTLLPDEIEYLKPDYDLYPEQCYSMGFTTRGCIRKCYFCIVPQKEGPLTRWQHPKEFHDSRFKMTLLLDNNWLADKEWFFETSAWLRDNQVAVREGGMDIRLLEEDIAQRLSELKWAKPLKFAFDSDNDADAVSSGLNLLRKHGIDPRQKVRVYVYLNDNQPKHIESAIWRCRQLKSWNTTPLVMFNIDQKRGPEAKHLQRWTGKPWIFWSCDIDDYGKAMA
jgi:hypothetical protein